jgi:hypothetical protein
MWHTAKHTFCTANQITDSEVFSVEFEVLTAVFMKNSIFWNITTSRALLVTCFHAGLFLGAFFDSEDGGDMFLRNVG